MNLNQSNIYDSFAQAVQQLEAIYATSEAKNILRIYFEDAFGITNLQQRNALSEQQSQQLSTAVTRMLQHEPVQYILGEADFFGYKFKVTSAVLIPRPETEELVDLILTDYKKIAPHINDLQILDIGTGSGCIPITLKKKLPKAALTAIDVSASALAIAEQNAQLNQVEVQFTQLDILNQQSWQQFHDQQFTVIVSNPPYIPYSEQVLMAKNVLEYEPRMALFVNDNTPLIFYQIIAQFAQAKLSQNGRLYFECNEYNAQLVQKMLQKMKFTEVVIIKDMSGKERMIRADWQLNS